MSQHKHLFHNAFVSSSHHLLSFINLWLFWVLHVRGRGKIYQQHKLGFHVHWKRQTFYAQYFTLHNIKKGRKKSWGLSTSALVPSMSFDFFFSCFGFLPQTSVSLSSHSQNIIPNAETAILHVKVEEEKWSK